MKSLKVEFNQSLLTMFSTLHKKVRGIFYVEVLSGETNIKLVKSADNQCQFYWIGVFKEKKMKKI